MDFFDFKLDSIYVRNNRDFFKSSEVKIFSLLTTSNYDIAMFEKVVNAKNEGEKLALLKQAAETVIGYKEIIEVQNIKDKHRISFGNNGYSLYRSHTVPDYFDLSICIMDSDRGIRELGERLKKITNGPIFNSFASNLLTAIGIVATPQIIAAIKVTEFIAKQVAQELSANKDDQVGVYCESFNIWQDYPNLNLKGIDIPDLSNNCLISYNLFGRRSDS